MPTLTEKRINCLEKNAFCISVTSTQSHYNKVTNKSTSVVTRTNAAAGGGSGARAQITKAFLPLLGVF